MSRRKAPVRMDITDAPRALVLQGGGALGAYQAGVYAGASEKGSPTGLPAFRSARSTRR